MVLYSIIFKNHQTISTYMKKLTTGISLLFLWYPLQAQFNVSLEMSNVLPKVGVGYKFNPRIWVTASCYGDGSISQWTADAAFRYNFVASGRFDFYAGVGSMFNRIAIIFPVGVRFSPINNFRNLSLHAELIHAIGRYDPDTWYWGYGTIGVRYQFGKKSK